MKFSITGLVFRYITSYFFSLGTIYFNLELLINEDLSWNSVRCGRTTVCIVFFIWVLLEGGIIIFQIKFFIDSVKVHS